MKHCDFDLTIQFDNILLDISTNLLWKFEIFSRHICWGIHATEVISILVLKGLINVLKHNRYKYILTIIDLYTRYTWEKYLKNKAGVLVNQAFEKIFEESNYGPKQL